MSGKAFKAGTYCLIAFTDDMESHSYPKLVFSKSLWNPCGQEERRVAFALRGSTWVGRRIGIPPALAPLLGSQHHLWDLPLPHLAGWKFVATIRRKNEKRNEGNVKYFLFSLGNNL